MTGGSVPWRVRGLRWRRVRSAPAASLRSRRGCLTRHSRRGRSARRAIPRLAIALRATASHVNRETHGEREAERELQPPCLPQRRDQRGSRRAAAHGAHRGQRQRQRQQREQRERPLEGDQRGQRERHEQEQQVDQPRPGIPDPHGERALARLASDLMSRRLLTMSSAHESSPAGTEAARPSQPASPSARTRCPATAAMPKKTNTATSPSPRYPYGRLRRCRTTPRAPQAPRRAPSTTTSPRPAPAPRSRPPRSSRTRRASPARGFASARPDQPHRPDPAFGGVGAAHAVAVVVGEVHTRPAARARPPVPAPPATVRTCRNPPRRPNRSAPARRPRAASEGGFPPPTHVL